MTAVYACTGLVALASFSGSLIGMLTVAAVLELTDRYVRRRRQGRERP